MEYEGTRRHTHPCLASPRASPTGMGRRNVSPGDCTNERTNELERTINRRWVEGTDELERTISRGWVEGNIESNGPPRPTRIEYHAVGQSEGPGPPRPASIGRTMGQPRGQSVGSSDCPAARRTSGQHDELALATRRSSGDKQTSTRASGLRGTTACEPASYRPDMNALGHLVCVQLSHRLSSPWAAR